MVTKKLSVIIPCLNEARTITNVLDAIATQTFPLDTLEVILADGGSTDGTQTKIKDFQSSHNNLSIMVISNPKKIIPAALNEAIRASRGEIILRLDGHAIPDKNYLRYSVEDLVNGKGDNVGGIWIIKPGGQGWIARAIAASASHPLAVGDAKYRYTREAGIVDTVPFGCFYKKLVKQIGYFDESLLTNEDYEFNARIRKSGGKVFLDPRIQSQYIARPTIGQLARQYWRYGYWKLKMLRRYPETLRLRQALPPIFITSILILSFMSIGISYARILLALEIVVYLLAILASVLVTALKRKDISLMIGMPISIAIMHFSWGAGFLASLFTRDYQKKPL